MRSIKLAKPIWLLFAGGGLCLGGGYMSVGLVLLTIAVFLACAQIGDK